MREPATSEGCADTCLTTIGGDFFQGSEFTADTSSEQGKALASRCAEMVEAATTDPHSQTTTSSGRTPVEAVKPELAVTISNVVFSDLYEEGGQIRVTWLGEYIQGVYTYLLGGALAIAIVLVMVRGAQYVLAAGGASNTQKAMDGIKAAAVGLVLLLSVSAILYVVNPQLLNLDSIILDTVEYQQLLMYTEGDEGSGVMLSGGIANLPQPYQSIYQDAQANGVCHMSQGQYMLSPTGGAPNFGQHHWYDRGVGGENAEGDWQKINNMDWGAPFGNPIYAPFSGTVSYTESTTRNSCGNSLVLKGNGAKITICHVRDFFDTSGNLLHSGDSVSAGEAIGHVGGQICVGETPITTKYDSSSKSNPSMEKCVGPTTWQDCQCQKTIHAGNTSGAHVHVTWSESLGGDLLACMQDSSTIGDAALQSTTPSVTEGLTETEEEEVAESYAAVCEDVYTAEADYTSCCTSDGATCYDETGAYIL